MSVKIEVTYSELKTFSADRDAPLHFVETSKKYFIFSTDGPVIAETRIIKKSPISSDQSDFETNFKTDANKEVIQKTRRKSSGMIKTIIVLANENWQTHTFSDAALDCVTMRHDGTQNIGIAWDTDDKDASPDPVYRTLKPNVETPIFGIAKDTQLHYKRIAGSGDHRLEITAWG